MVVTSRVDPRRFGGGTSQVDRGGRFRQKDDTCPHALRRVRFSKTRDPPAATNLWVSSLSTLCAIGAKEIFKGHVAAFVLTSQVAWTRSTHLIECLSIASKLVSSHMIKPSDFLKFCKPDGGHVRMQVRSLRDKLAVVLNKTANDDRLVSALRAENASLKKVCLSRPQIIYLFQKTSCEQSGNSEQQQSTGYIAHATVLLELVSLQGSQRVVSLQIGQFFPSRRKDVIA